MKYEHLVRENIFRVLQKTPKWVVEPLVSAHVAVERQKMVNLMTPLVLVFFVTKRCNALCDHCFYWEQLNTETEELSLQQIETVVRSLKHPLNTVSLTGGEPFVRNDLFSIVKLFVEINRTKKVNIVTNGTYTDRTVSTIQRVLDELDSVAVNVGVSLDDFEDAHDKIRKVKIFRHAVETVKRLKQIAKKYKNLTVSVKTTVFKDNFKNVEKFRQYLEDEVQVAYDIQYMRSPKFDVYDIDREILSGYDPQESEKHQLSLSEMKEVFDVFYSKKATTNRLLNNYSLVLNEGILEMKNHERQFVKCLAGKYDGVLYSNGEVAFCEMTTAFTKIQDYDFDFFRAWNSPESNPMRAKISKCFCTHTCNLMNAMRVDKDALMKVIYPNNARDIEEEKRGKVVNGSHFDRPDRTAT